ncbi:hypothetical protein SNE40_015772 [Patella caerulea]|uniref:Cysteine and tyrosine-rich protein 1 n=1 Tax=Patella caerulea TaxID=87958 RepID=A0AAN8JHQ8_PATCE
MAAAFNITFYLFCLWSFIQVITTEFCNYYDSYINSDIRYCSYGCCNTRSGATFSNVCCDYPAARSSTGIIIGIIVGVVALIITTIVVIVIIVCCCCKRQPATQGHVITAPNTAVVYSNTTQTSMMHPGVAYPPSNTFNPPQGTNNSSSTPNEFAASPPAYDTVTSP